MKGISKLAVSSAALCLGLAACTAAQENGSATESPSPTPQSGASGGTTSTAPATSESTSAPDSTGLGTTESHPVTSQAPGTGATSPATSSTDPPVTPPSRTERKSAMDMTPEEAMNAVINGQITMGEYCSRDTFLTSGDTQMCYYFNHPEITLPPPDYGEGSWRDSPTRYRFTYYEAYSAWQQGMPYYEAFCLNYVPVTPEGESQCIGIESGTVDSYRGEYLGP